MKTRKKRKEEETLAISGQCGTCKLACHEDQDAIECDGCKTWFHVGGCSNVSKKGYLSYSEGQLACEGFHWFCKECRPNKKKVKDQVEIKAPVQSGDLMKKMESRMEQMVNSSMAQMKLAQLEMSKIQCDLRKQLEEVMKVSDSFKGSCAPKTYARAVMAKSSKVVQKDRATTSSVVEEERVSSTGKTGTAKSQRKSRDCNVIVFNLKEGNNKEDDIKMVEQLFHHLKLKKDPVKFFRLGKKVSTKIRPVKINFDNVEAKKRFFSSLFNLKTAAEQFKKIQVQHDLSKDERDKQSELFKQARSMNEKNTSNNFSFKVRGPPSSMKVVKVRRGKKILGKEAGGRRAEGGVSVTRLSKN